MVKVEIDEGSGFCFGVVTAIHKAEEELAKGVTLYCLGDIVHNSREVERLKEMGLITINHEEFKQLHNAKVLLRAHGEPPETYIIAKENNIEIIDATCPVVLRLQKRIKQEYMQEDLGEKTNRNLRKERTCGSLRSGRADNRQSYCDRKARRGSPAGFQQKHTPVLADNQITG